MSDPTSLSKETLTDRVQTLVNEYEAHLVGYGMRPMHVHERPVLEAFAAWMLTFKELQS
jgi:hypothetical protein